MPAEDQIAADLLDRRGSCLSGPEPAPESGEDCVESVGIAAVKCDKATVLRIYFDVQGVDRLVEPMRRDPVPRRWKSRSNPKITSLAGGVGLSTSSVHVQLIADCRIVTVLCDDEVAL